MTALSRLPRELRLADLLDVECHQVAGVIPLDLTLDSRDVKPGSVFIAVPGVAGDGRDFIADALSSGAAAVVAEAANDFVFDDARVLLVPDLRGRLPALARRFYADPSASMALVAVTGTNGKTSVTDFVAQMLRRLGVATGSIGTLGARLVDSVVEARNTTPDLFSLNRQLCEWLNQDVDHVVMEASSHALDQGRMHGLNIHTGVFTNLSRDHLDYHGDEAAYLEAKLRLFTDFPLKRAIYNADDPAARRIPALAGCPSLGVSFDYAEADVFVQLLDVRQGLAIRLHSPWGTRDIHAPLSGAFNAFNVVVAVLAVTGLGYPLPDVVAAAEQLLPVPGRMQSVSVPADIRVLVDYAHTPDALENALNALRGAGESELWVVFGCGGDRDRGKRQLMGHVASTLADRVVVTSDNPRTEPPEKIIEDILSGIGADVDVIGDRAAAIEFAIVNAAPGATVLLAGKGHETYQEVSGRRSAFDDGEVAAAALRRRLGDD